MADKRALDNVEKKELDAAQEHTTPGKYYAPASDIYETQEEIVVSMEMPGVGKSHLDVQLDNDVLTVEGKIDSKEYADLTPLYTEYNVGHFRRSFKISSEIDRDKIEAKTEDGVLVLRLPKAEEEKPRRIKIR